MLFCSYDLDLDPMTLINENKPDIVKIAVKIHLRIKNEVSRSRLSYVRSQTVEKHTQTDVTESITIHGGSRSCI